MNKPLLVVPLLLAVLSLHATTYYSINNSNPNLITSWRTNRNGTGLSPANFTSGDVFIIQSEHSITTTANWTISGANGKLLLETGSTFQADDKVTVPAFEIQGTGTYIHNKPISNFPGTNTRTFSATSTVKIQEWTGTTALPSPTTWGNLIIDVGNYTSNWNQAGNLTDVAGTLTIRNTGSNEFRFATSQDYTMTIGGDLVIEAGTVEAAQSNGNHTQAIIIGGSFRQSGGTFTRSNNNANTLKIQFTGSSSQFISTGGTLTDTYIDWIVNSGAKLVLNNNLPIAASRSLTVNGTLDCSSSQVTGSGAFILSPSGNLITSSSSGVNGSIVVTGTKTYNTTGSYEFHHATTSPFPTGSGAVTAANVVVDADITLNRDLNISGNLTLTTGKLTIPTGNTVTLPTVASISGSGFGVSKHIVTQVNTTTGAKGIIRVSNVTGTLNLPVGDGTNYLPLALTTSTANDFSVTVFQGSTQNGTPNGTVLTAAQKKTVVDAVWIINRNSGSGTVGMTLSWPTSLEGSTFQTLANNQVGIAHYGGYWETALGAGDQAQHTATRTGITMFSPFAVGQIGTVLPLKFGDIHLSKTAGGGVNVDWTGSEQTNLDHFNIERSSNGQQFNAVGKTDIITNSSKADYSWTDTSPMHNVNYYRIAAADIDGRKTYSGIAMIDLSQKAEDLNLFPNPVVNRRLSIQAAHIEAGTQKLVITNLYGRTVYYETFEHGPGMMSKMVQLPVDVFPGVYSFTLTGGGQSLQKTFVVK